MPRASVNGIELEYEVLGEGAPLVLIMGIGAQLVHWPDGFLDALMRRGFQLIRFDNRDCGLSTSLDHFGVPPWRKNMARGLLGLPVEAPYTLSDMADDVAGLLDELGLDRAHVVGVSMGGMIAQTMALRHPDRMLTMTSVMSHTGARRVALGQPVAIRALLNPPPRNVVEAMDGAVDFYRICGSKGFALDIDDIRLRARRMYERGINPRGFARQLSAILATGNRTAALRFVRVPTLVLHGTVDPLIRPAGGRATARAIPGAKLRMIEGMGHDLPPGAHKLLADAIAGHAGVSSRAVSRRVKLAPGRTSM